ncbi:uncharacterized protein KY384_007705 [Bacidia gigantensis]|uniref:uncharacterized protein n=1 Tax=Bacidia gigantensis TaxID=2732470 RepID=UPI001D05B811|nr:uncharacterized protein KY384_007705 [Bacidia gigantensis]KAG8527553.1 hypothetical protein KY384_007705 [Bacidia gigantensis]
MGGYSDRQQSSSYAHTRQPSKAPSQGRNGAHAPSQTTSPASPELAGASSEGPRHLNDYPTGADLTAFTAIRCSQLEDIIFDRLQRLDSNTFAEFPFYTADREIYTQLLGVMSSRNLGRVASLFTNDLQKSQWELFSNKGVPPRELESKIDMMIRSMKHIHLKTRPDGLWRDSCTILVALAELLVSSHGPSLKYAYCNLFVDLLLPVASNWTSQLQTPRYQNFLHLVTPRVGSIVVKPRHWPEAISCSSILLCVSPNELFASSWLSHINSLQPKLKDRSTRTLALQSVTRVVWTYLDRIKEASTTIRRLEDIMKVVLPSNKKTSHTPDTMACEPLAELIRIIGYHHQEYCFSKIIFPLLSFDLFATGKDIKVDQLDPERMVIGIKAYLLIMNDLGSDEGGKPPFPRFGQGGLAIADGNISAFSIKPSTGAAASVGDSRSSFGASPVATTKLSSSAREYHSRFCEILGKIVIICDNAFGGQAVLDEKFGGGLTPKPLSQTHSTSVTVTIGFARFIFNFDARYATMLEEGLLGPDHIESTLSLYVQLLQIWIEEIRQKSKEAASGSMANGLSSSRGRHLDLTSVTNHVDEVESHGVFFLCSQSRRVRAFAIKVLRIITEFDAALGRKNSRIIHILEGDSQHVMSANDGSLSVAERSRLQKGRIENTDQAEPTLVELCSSDVSYDSTLWLKMFPNIIRLSFDLCPSAVMLGREIVCARLLQMQDTITFLDTDLPNIPLPPPDSVNIRTTHRLQSTSSQVVVEQWKLYLIMACTTVTNAGAQTQSQLDKTQHSRKISKPAPQGQDKLSSARALFAYVIPLLSNGNGIIREAIVIALSSINTSLFRTLLESLQYAVTTCKEAAKQRIGSHQRTGSNPHRTPSTDRLRTEVTQVYRLTARFLMEPSVMQDEWILSNLCAYARDLMIFLGDGEVQSDWESQKLRQQFCGLVEELARAVSEVEDTLQYMPFEFRRSAFTLMEEWCGYSPHQAKIAHREDAMKQTVIERYANTRERDHYMALMDGDKRDLGAAALGAMAALCAGPIRVKTDRGESLSFDSRRMLSWVDQVFGSSLDKWHAIGRKALYNLIASNKNLTSLLKISIEQCYTPDRPRAVDSYFEVVSKVLREHVDYDIDFWRVLAALLFLLGNEKSEIRVQSAKLLQLLEQRSERNSRIQDFDISISDRTTAVYKSASFEISLLEPFQGYSPGQSKADGLRSPPWIQEIILQVEPDGRPTSPSYMVLANLLEITTTSSSVLNNEVQALWKALATGHPGNVQLVLDFVISLCLDRRDQALVYYSKQIIVYVASDVAGPKVVEFLLLKVTPKNLVATAHEPTPPPADSYGFPYIADLSEALPIANKQDMFALSHLAVVFLVDLIVAPMTIKAENVPLLLHVIFVLWDNQISLVQEQARELLVHLIHELVITKIPKELQEHYKSRRSEVEGFVDAIRHHEASLVWQYRERVAKYEDWDVPNPSGDDKRLPSSMPKVTSQVVDIFALVYSDIKDRLARISLSWGTSCPVRHAACRSLQIFRCVLVPIDQPMLSDILARISNTVVADSQDVQTFSMEMLATVKSIIIELEPADLLLYPHIFWTTCACLDTNLEREFIAAVGMLDKLLPKVNLEDPAVLRILEKAKPARWQGTFEGLTPLLYKGVKSEISLSTSLGVLDKLLALPNNELVGNQSRLLFTILANLPRFLQSFEDDNTFGECGQTAHILSSIAEIGDQTQISTVLDKYIGRSYADSNELLSEILAALQKGYFPTWELKALIFAIGLLSNSLRWYKLQALRVVRSLITDVDTRRPEISDYGPDLISPLLTLLQTEFCSQAIEVVDQFYSMTETPLTQDHMRMSIFGQGLRPVPVQKEYEKTQSLYGMPEETGWSIPMPAKLHNTTRANMQLIYQDCANLNVPAAEAVVTPDVEFQVEDDQAASYFCLERSETLDPHDLVEGGRDEGEPGDLLTKLNSLDDFFNDSLDTEDQADSRYSSLTTTPYQLDPVTGAEIYDQETAPILQRTLAGAGSAHLLHSSNFERSNLSIMTPAAFTPATASVGTGPARPSLHARSVTSPANNISRKAHNIPESFSDDEQDDGILSEDERSTGHIVANGSRLLGNPSKRSDLAFRKVGPGLEGKEYKQRGAFFELRVDRTVITPEVLVCLRFRKLSLR